MNAHPSRLLSPMFAAFAVTVAQTPVSVGKGSYASFPPPQAGATVDSFQRVSRLDVLPGETRPIPTNDWWTNVLTSPFGGDLWSHPLVSSADALGARVWFPLEPAANGDGMQRGNPIRIGGGNFAPTRDLAADWGDWHVVVRLEDGAKHLDMTLVRGMPLVWFEVEGFAPTLWLPAGAKAYTASGSALALTATTLDRLVIAFDGRSVGVQLPAGTKVSSQAGSLALELPPNQGWFSLAALPDSKDLDAWRAWGTTIPRKTDVRWERTPGSSMRTTWEVTGQDMSGGSNANFLQTFLPHQWREAIVAPTWRPETWLCPRGRLKSASGSRFVFEHAMPGIVPEFGPADADPASDPSPWSKVVQDELTTGYFSKSTYGADTYWGGKDLVLLAKHAVFAQRTGHPQAASILAKARSALVDWLTWTPGEAAHYFAYYPRWKALVGFQESYGSSQFTDNHFHYGYLIHAAALVGTLDRQFLSEYGPMLRRIVQQYAAWDKNNPDYPFLRTFEPWTGHSYAGGTGSPTGNNQESTSEAMQSWIGMFLLGAAMGDTAMRDAGAFGYQSESRATLEYWFDWKHGNFAPGWKHSNVGIVFDGGNSYGTWFSANPLHIHAIQYLPIAPGFDYLVRDTAWARSEYAAMQREATASEGYADETDYGDDWANVAFSFRQLFEPAEVCRRFSVDRTTGKGWTKEINAGVTYAYAHANRQLGPRAWDYTYSLPTVAGFRHPATGIVTHVAWNPDTVEVSCEVRSAGKPVGIIRLPARSVVRHRMDAKLVGLEIATPAKTLPVGVATRISITGRDQYGASIDVGRATWKASSGTISNSGDFLSSTASDSVRIEAIAGGLTVSTTVRCGDKPRLARLEIHPAYVQILTNQSARLKVRGVDQYGDPIPLVSTDWTASAGAKVDASGTVTSTNAGTSWIFVRSDARIDSIPLDSYDRLVDLVAGSTATASSSLGANTAAKAIDNSRTTRWESEHGIDPSWIQVAFPKSFQLVQTVIDWENAAARRYRVQVSEDGKTWSDWAAIEGGDGGIDSLTGKGHGRFARVLGLERTTAYGYSMFELRLRGFPRTAYSALLDADTADWTESDASVEPKPVLGRKESIRIGNQLVSLDLRPDERVVSVRLLDPHGRVISRTPGGLTTCILLVTTNLGRHASPIALTP